MESPKLTRRERERIIFDYLKGKPDPLYEVHETNHGKYVVEQKQIQLEEEETKEEPIKQEKPSRNQLKRERRRQNRRAKADAYRILEQLNRLLNTNEEPSNDSSDDEQENDDEESQGPRAPPIINQPNLNPNPGPLTFRRKRLRF